MHRFGYKLVIKYNIQVRKTTGSQLVAREAISRQGKQRSEKGNHRIHHLGDQIDQVFRIYLFTNKASEGCTLCPRVARGLKRVGSTLLDSLSSPSSLRQGTIDLLIQLVDHPLNCFPGKRCALDEYHPDYIYTNHYCKK